MSTRRWITAGAAALVVILGVPGAAQAASYRYWTYWISADDGWRFASAGPAFRIPADGSVEGWHFSISGVSGDSPPAASPDFETVCAETPAPSEGKRVAVVVDPGTSADAPEGEQPPGAWAMCVVAPDRATGYDVLRAAAGVRVERGLICGINGYPTAECAVVVNEPTPSPSPTKSPSPSPTKPSPTKPIPTKPSPTKSPGPAQSSPTQSSPTQPSPTMSPSPAQPSPTTSPSASLSSASLSGPSLSGTAAPSESASAATAPTASQSTGPAPDASASPSLSLLAEPVPPADGGGPSSVLMAGVGILAIGALAGAAVIRGRREST